MKRIRSGTRRIECMTDVFVDGQGFTTAGSAVAILLACTLAFFCVWSARAQSQAAGVQAVADSMVLAAENEVAEFILTVRVADATLLTMSLTGLAALAVGTVCCCVPAGATVGTKLIEAGKTILSKRDDVARGFDKTLNAAQDALPALAQAQAQVVLQENADAIGGSALGLVELVPSEAPDVKVGTSKAGTEAAEAADAASGELIEAAQEAEDAAQEAADAKIRAWEYDCGLSPQACMAERAQSLSSITDAENPIALSVETWSFADALERAQAYYAHRAQDEAPASSSVEEQVRSAMRSKFYEYAIAELAEGRAIDDGTTQPDLYFPELYRNTAQMRETYLYTEKVYPVSGGALHAYEGCPGIDSVEGSGSLEQLELGTYEECEVCQFDADSLGRVASASTSIGNGFEYYYRKVAELANEYSEAQAKALPAANEVKEQAQGVLDIIMEALDELAGERVEAYPPGRYGALAGISFTDDETEADSSFFAGEDSGTFAAVSAAILVEDEEENALASLLDGVAEDIGSPLTDAGATVLELWGTLIGAYGSGVEGLTEGIENLLDSIPLVSASGLGTWASETLTGMLESAGLEPSNTASAKPVVANTEHVATRGDGTLSQAILTLKGESSSETRRIRSPGPRRFVAISHRSAGRRRERRLAGQMTVEAAYTLPVMVAIAFILVNALIFVGDCTAFDIVARDAIRLQADDGYEGVSGAAEVRARIEEGLSMDYEKVAVTCERTELGHVRYTATIEFSPPFLSGATIFGVSVPTLEHEVTMTVSPYRKGVVI